MRLIAVKIVLVLGLVVSVATQNTNPKREIQTAYNRYFDALRHKDLSAALQMLDPGFTAHLADGAVLDFAGQEESLRELILYASAIGDAKVNIEQVQTESADATVILRSVLFYASTGEKPDSFTDKCGQ